MWNELNVNSHPDTSDGSMLRSWREMYGEAYIPPVPVVAGMLGKGFYLLAGNFKTGKTYAALQISHQVAIGQPIWGRETRQGSVLFVAKEDSEAGLRDKLSRVDDSDGTEGVSFLRVKRVEIPQVKTFLQSHPNTRLVVIDALTKEELKAVSEWKTLAEEYGVCILAVHHTKASDCQKIEKELYGNTGPMAGADGMLMLEKVDAEYAVLAVLARNFPEQQL